jgi:biopolymer transport protein ExbB/TolQ
MNFNVIELWHGMNGLVRTVVTLLTIQGVATLAVTVDRLMMLIMSYRRGRKFAKKAGPVLAKGDLSGALALAKEDTHSHLASFIRTGVETFVSRRKAGLSQEKAAELAARALERKADSLGDSLNKGMAIMASTGSTAPFIGLLGTVLGILNAFKLVGQNGSGGMGTIGVAIAEALIVTGYGLMVAIPSVLLFNMLSTRLAKYEAGLNHARNELVDLLAGSPSELHIDSATKEAPAVRSGGERASKAVAQNVTASLA